MASVLIVDDEASLVRSLSFALRSDGFAVESIGSASEAAPFRRPSFKASYTCPHCHVSHDYSSGDLMLSVGSMEDDLHRRAR